MSFTVGQKRGASARSGSHEDGRPEAEGREAERREPACPEPACPEPACPEDDLADSCPGDGAFDAPSEGNVLAREARPRRTEGRRVRGRSARVVEQVLFAALEQLGRVGYAALRIEDVASASGVNKTTIYRRWPTKLALVGAALRQVKRSVEMPDTGSIRSDFLASLDELLRFAESPTGRGIIRALHTEAAHPEVATIVRDLRHEQAGARRRLIERAVARGELPPGTDPDFLLELVHATIFSRVMAQETCGSCFREKLVDFVLTAARSYFTGGAPSVAGSAARDQGSHGDL